MSKIDLKLITLDGVQFSGAVESATIPTSSGQITVLPHHSPLISELKPGELIARAEGEQKRFTIGEGVLEVRRSGVVIILADSVELLN